jgi:hypothetical protein
MSEEPYYQADKTRSPRFEQHVKSRSTWLRLVFMILFAVISSVARLVIGVVVLVQFLHVLFTGETNRKLLDFGQSLATYLYEIMVYLTFNSEVRPFPLDAPWPAPDPRSAQPAPPPPPPTPPPSTSQPPPTSPPPSTPTSELSPPPPSSASSEDPPL